MLESRFNFQEVREIGRLSHDGEAMVAMRDSLVYAIPAMRMTDNQQLTWEAFRATIPGIERLEGRGELLLKGVFDRFHENRQVIAYWENESSERVWGYLRASFNVPEDIQIDTITYHDDFAAVHMSDSEMQRFFRVWDPEISKVTKIGGFASTRFFLQHPKTGKRSPVVVVPTIDKTNILIHEGTHANLDSYYFRRELLHTPPFDPIRYQNNLSNELGDIKKNSAEEILQRVAALCSEEIATISYDLRSIYHEELIVEAVQGSFAREPKSIKIITDYFDPFIPIGKLSSGHYGIILHNRLMQLIDMVYDIPQLSQENRTALVYDIFLEKQKFFSQIVTMSQWATQLWQNSKHKPEVFAASLASVSLSRPWTIGHFIDESPHDLQETFPKSPEPTWRMQRQMVEELLLHHMQRHMGNQLLMMREQLINVLFTSYRERIPTLKEVSVLDGNDIQDIFDDAFAIYSIFYKTQMANLYKSSESFYKVLLSEIPLITPQEIFRRAISTTIEGIIGDDEIIVDMLKKYITQVEGIDETNIQTMQNTIDNTYHVLFMNGEDNNNGYIDRMEDLKDEFWEGK